MTKTVHFVSAALVTVFSSLAVFHWGDFVSPVVAGEITMGLGVAKMVLTMLDGGSGGSPA